MDLDRDELLEVVLALECKIIEGTDTSTTFQLKFMLMETKRIYNELGGSYECWNIFRSLQTDAKSVLFTDKQINDKLLKKLRKSKYDKDKKCVDLFNVNADKFVESNEK